MRNLDLLTAERLLSVKAPESLFSQSIPEAKQEYRVLVRRWHPDCQNLAVAPLVFSHVVSLYSLARRKLLDGSWSEPAEKIEEETPGLKRFRLIDRSIKAVAYTVARPFELGHMFIGDHSVAFEIQDEYADLYLRGLSHMRSIKFKNSEMAVEMSQYLPQVADAYKTGSSSILVVRKTPDQLLLADVLSHFGGKILPIEHVGWILNVLYNLGCYLSWANITHNAISPNSFFISPLRHTGMLLGGWWYAAPIDAQMSALPDYSLRFIPPDILRNKRADSRTDLELIKSIGRSLLGDAVGAQLLLDKSLPRAMVEWLQLPSTGSAAKDYASWKHGVLETSFGSPRFVSLKLEANHLYKED